MAQCGLEKNCVRAIEGLTAINELPEYLQANHQNLYESEMRSYIFGRQHIARLYAGCPSP